MAKHSSHILEMARKGAEHRYAELQAEIAALVKHFPHVAKNAGKQISKAVSHGVAAVEAEAPKVRRRAKQMSAAARKAVSDRMKKYWAKRRSAKSKGK
jgi:uncharacterized protein YicC (UPF0701 family)